MLVTLKGTGFGKGATVTFGGVSATNVVVATSHFITCETPTHAAGAVNVVVTNPDGASSNVVTYTYLATPVWWEPDWPTVVLPKTVPVPPLVPPVGPCDIVITGAPHAGTVGVQYSPIVFGTTGGVNASTPSLYIGSLPPGLSLKGGSLVGTPSVDGVFSFVLISTDADGCAGYAGYAIIVWPVAEDFTAFPFPYDDLDPAAPPKFTIPFPITPGGGGGIPTFPPGTIFTWKVKASPPPDKGWWASVGEDFSGAGHVIENAVPRNPRGFVETTTFSTGASSFLGGFPGVVGTWRNNLIYARGGYVVGTDLPTVRMFDGNFDREVVSIPLTSAGVVPKAVLSILVANDTIYLSTFDSGTSTTDWSGRVFSLDPDRGTITPLGVALPIGQLPYALAWHMGRLWVGTNRGNPSYSGKVYFFRPDIDTAWTQDHDLTSDSQGGVASLLSFKGLLYVGTTGAAGTFAKVLVRSGVGVYTTSDTGSGGTATSGNAFIALAEYKDKLYSSYFNNDATKVSKIRSFNGSAWSTSYTGSGTTLVPFLGFPIDLSTPTLLAIGGGVGFDAILVSTPDGTTWSDRTVFLDQSSPASSGLPAFGMVFI